MTCKTSKPSILLVEDSSILKETLEDILLKEGYNVCSSENGFDAQVLLKKNNYDLVITDIFMPICDGYELIRRIHSGAFASAKPKIIAISGGNREIMSDIALDSLKSQVECILKKPMSKKSILTAIRESLGQTLSSNYATA